MSIPSQSTTSNGSCDRLNSNHSLLNSSFVCLSFMEIPNIHLIICSSALSNCNPTLTSKNPETVSYPRHVTTHTTSPLVNHFSTYCALNRVFLHSFPTVTTGPLYRVYNHLPTIATNHHFRLSCILPQSFVNRASSLFNHTSAKLFHCWCHKK